MLQMTPSLNLHYESPQASGDKKVWEALPLFSQSMQVVLALLHFPSGHILCPVHEAPTLQGMGVPAAPGVLGRDRCAIQAVVLGALQVLVQTLSVEESEKDHFLPLTTFI